jgi:NAD(P)-dependent dehydrogenase (short-subunit alcohol dehydrogenase family)
MPTVLITGANRGLGLEFARQYAAEGWQVIAGCRHPRNALDLKALEGAVSVHALDVTDERSIDALAHEVSQTAFDILLLNAGVHLQKDCTLKELDAGLWLRELRVNSIAPVILARRFVEHVARSQQKRIIAISSGSGSISRVSEGGNYAYRTGKAALNAAMKILAADLAVRGITVAAIGPGHTRTDMGGGNAPYSAQESVATVRATISRLRFEDSGSFLNRDGSHLAW